MHSIPGRRIRLIATVGASTVTLLAASVFGMVAAASAAPAPRVHRAVAPAPEAPSGPTAEAYVRAAYHDFLGRRVDPDGLAYWSGRLTSGASSESQFVSGLAHSTEWVGHVVDGFYEDTLGRPGDAGGVAYWVGLLQSGKQTPAQVAASFYASDEYFDGVPISGGSSRVQAWITDLYVKLLGRTPDPGGLAYWTAQVAARGRITVAYAFYQSDESCRHRVTALYEHFLFRAPDAGGLTYWAGRLPVSGDLALAANLTSVGSEYFDAAPHRLFATQLTTDDNTTCAIDETAAAYCWGFNASGQLGDATTNDSTTPQRVLEDVGTPLTGVSSIVTSGGTTCAIADPNRTAYCWGDNTDGSAAAGQLLRQLVARPVTGPNGPLVDVAAITHDSFTGCAVAGANRTAYCWGNNVVGTVGDGTTTNAHGVEAVVLGTGTLTDVVAIDVENATTCAIARLQQDVYCWGENGFGQVGDGTTTNRLTATSTLWNGMVLGDVGQLTSGPGTRCALAASTEYCWGKNGGGEAADGTITDRTVAGPVRTGTGITPTGTLGSVDGLSSAIDTGCAIAGSGQDAYCWGFNSWGEAGNGTTARQVLAQQVHLGPSSLSGVSAIATGDWTTCATAGATRTAYCWGLNAYGELGDGTVTNSDQAQAVSLGAGALRDVSSIVVGAHTPVACAIAEAGDVYCWGRNFFGVLGNGSTTDAHTPQRVTH